MEAANKLGVDFVALAETANTARQIIMTHPLIAVRGHAAFLMQPMVAVVDAEILRMTHFPNTTHSQTRQI